MPRTKAKTKANAKPKAKPHALRETDLYGPVRDYLIAQGYTVRGEVHDCDLAATKGNDLILIELKTRFNLDLLIQAARRQRTTDSVYVALPRPASQSRRDGWSDVTHLLRRLELGLILVALAGKNSQVEVVFHPLPFERKKSRKKKRAVLQEMAGRSVDGNLGGSNRRPVMTAYREAAILIACCLERHGPMTPRALRELETGAKTSSILSSNFYGWFERVERGVYTLTTNGARDLEKYSELTARYREELKG